MVTTLGNAPQGETVRALITKRHISAGQSIRLKQANDTKSLTCTNTRVEQRAGQRSSTGFTSSKIAGQDHDF